MQKQGSTLTGDTSIPANGKNNPHVLGPTITISQENISNIRGNINNRSVWQSPEFSSQELSIEGDTRWFQRNLHLIYLKSPNPAITSYLCVNTSDPHRKQTCLIE